MIEHELRTLVGGGEIRRVEVKAAEANSADLGRTIVALANSGGGILLRGIGDEGDIRGLRYAQLHRSLMWA
jgi:ATP-dependent DNA helicase RecG